MKTSKLIGIYKIVSPSGKVYIGQTINYKRRIQEYKSLRCSGQPRLYNSFIKHGFKNHTTTLIEECFLNELNEKERYYQELYNTLSEAGMNCQYVKTSTKKYKHSEETKQKISKSNIGKHLRNNFKLTKEHKEKIGKANKGNKRPDFAEIITKINKERIGSKNNFYGKKHTKESKEKISKAKKGKIVGFKGERTIIVLNTQTGIFYTLRDFSILVDRKIINTYKFNRTSKKIRYNFLIV